MSEGKDSFEILADELARMGQQIAHLQRTSLNKTEAEALNQQLVQGVASMAQTGQAVYEAISERMDLRLEKLAMETILAATDAARRAIEKSHAETSSAARDWPGGPERAYLDILKNFCRTDQAPGALRYMATFSAVNL